MDWVDNGMPSAVPNIFGAKACGESGASAAPPSVMNAIVDALSAFPRAGEYADAGAVDVWAVVAGRLPSQLRPARGGVRIA